MVPNPTSRSVASLKSRERAKNNFHVLAAIFLFLLTATAFAQKGEKKPEVTAPAPDIASGSKEWSRMQIGRALAKPVPEPKVSPAEKEANRLRYLGSAPDTSAVGFDPKTKAIVPISVGSEALAEMAKRINVKPQPGVAPKIVSGEETKPASQKSPEGGSGKAAADVQKLAEQALAATPPSAFTTPYNFPFNSEYRLLLRFNTGGSDYYYLCSASQSSSYQLLSAGHCVYNHDIKDDGSNIAGFAAEIWAWPAETDVVDPIDHNNWPDYPYGVAKASYWLTYNNWINSSDLNWDFSFITLDRRTGDHIGWMGREWGTTTSALNFDGYPAEAPYVPSNNPFQYPGYDANNVTNYTDNRIVMSAYTYGGHSGGGVWRYDSGAGNRYIEGVNSTSDRHGNAEATRFTSTNETTLENAITDDNNNRPPAALPQVIEYVFNNTSKGLIDTSASIGSSFEMTMNAFNAGYASAGDVSADVYLTQSSVGVTNGTYIGTVDLGTLDAYSATVQNQFVTVPRTVPPGFWYVGYHLRSANPQYGTDNPDVIITKQTLQTYCTADSFESDNSFSTASTLAVGGTQSHSICAQSDVDYVKFTLTGPSAITLKTSGGTTNGDTVLTLYNSSFGQISTNDDSNGTFYSQITSTCSASLPAGTYYAAVQSYHNATVIPAYNLSLSATACAPTMTNLSLAPSVVSGGASSTGTVTLSGPALSGGYVFTLASNNAAAHVPASVTVAAGATSVHFTITTSSVTAAATAQIKARFSATDQQTANLTINPQPKPALSKVSLNPSVVYGGVSTIGTVTLTHPALTGGYVATLTSNNAAAHVPASVTVPAGATTANFTITTTGVTANVTAQIKARYSATDQQTANLTIAPQPKLSSITISPTSVIGGTSSHGTLTISHPAAGKGFVIHLSDPSGAVSESATATVPTGSTTASFTITTTTVTSVQTVAITANDGAVSKSANLQVVPKPKLSAFAIAPNSVKGGSSTTGTVTISSVAPSGGFVIHVSDGSSSTTMPATVTVAAGQTKGTFTIATTAVTANKVVGVTATDGAASIEVNFTITK